MILCIQITRGRVDFNGDSAVIRPCWHQVSNLGQRNAYNLFNLLGSLLCFHTSPKTLMVVHLPEVLKHCSHPFSVDSAFWFTGSWPRSCSTCSSCSSSCSARSLSPQKTRSTKTRRGTCSSATPTTASPPSSPSSAVSRSVLEHSYRPEP